MNLFTLEAKIGLDTSEYEGSVQEAMAQGEELRAKLTDIEQASGSMSDKLSDAGDSAGDAAAGFDDLGDSAGDAADEVENLGNASSTFMDTFKAIWASNLLRNITNELIDFGKSSVEAASNLAEIQNVVDVTFEQNAGQIDQWAKTANKAYGLTELQAKKFASTMGAMMKSSGLAGDAVADMSMNLAELAADMASFYNLDYDLAFEKIRSGISGETEPLKQLGINMSAANLEAFALAQGIETTYSNMSQAEQVQLRYNYLMQATADAQGDFARTSDSLANATRTLDGNLTTLKSNIGQFLIPTLENAVGIANSLFEVLLPEEPLTTTIEEIEKNYGQTLEDITTTETDVQSLVGMLEELGEKSGLTADEQVRWKTICEQLVQTLPSLSSIINTQTGEIKGGTAAIREQTNAWAENARQQALATSMQEVEQARATAIKDAATAQVKLDLAEQRLNALYDERHDIAVQIAEKNGQSVDALEESMGQFGEFTWWPWEDADKGAEKRYNEITESMISLSEEIAHLSWENEQAQNNLEQGLVQYDATIDEINRLNEQYGVTTSMTSENASAVSELSQLYSDEQEAIAGLEEQLASLDAYRQAMTESMRQQIDTVVSGFQGMGMEELVQNFDENIDSMVHGLQDQTRYMEEYAANLKEAAEKGVDEGLLATLSDGSKESALYLQAIVNGAEDKILELNGAWLEVEESKETFAETLAAQQLAADEAYSAIEIKTNEMVDNLDQAEQARINAESTMSGLVSGLQSQSGALDAAISSINAKLSTLGLWTVGSIPRISTTSTFSTSQNAHGLDYVPTDEFPAWLHKGEAVLTRNEAEGWRAIQNQQSNPGMDLQGLADVILSAMGSVTLQMDKRTVGQILTPVVSEEIAREARSRRYDL